MAIYHYHRGIGKRALGKNAVFAAAYIRGEKRTCDRTGETKDFGNKPDVIYANTYIPNDAPQWAIDLRNSAVKDSEGKKHIDSNGEQFSNYAWNQIEFVEKRVDSQLYFHDDIAIPNCLSKEQAIELVDAFVKESLAINGLFCDVAIHWDDNNHHVHCLIPLRTLTDAGFSKKIRFTKASLTNEVNRIREAWAVAVNQKLQSLDINERVDHRSYVDRGIDLTPTVKVGKFNHFGNHDIALQKLQDNDMIKQDNAQKILNNPFILAEKILQERPLFDSEQIAHEIYRHALIEKMTTEDSSSIDDSVSCPVLDELLLGLQHKEGIINERHLKAAILEKTSSEDEFERIYNAIVSHDDILKLGLGEDGRQHYVSRQAFDLETNLVNNTHLLANKKTFEVSERLVHQVGQQYGLNEAQQRALLHLTRSGNAAIICGYAGTGKTYMLKAAKEIWEQSGYQLIGLSTSGKAASGLEIETGIQSKTIHSFLYSVKNNYITVDDKTILIMDEMGMTSLDDMSSIVTIAREQGAKFTGVGDIEQTQPVGRGAPQRAMVDAIGAVYLDTIIRQKIDWQRDATMLFETNQTAAGFDLYDAHGCILFHESNAIAAHETVARWYANFKADPDGLLSDFTMAAFKNESVDSLNSMARKMLVDKDELDSGRLIKTEHGQLSIASGDRLLFTKNDSKTGVRNGDFATILSIAEDSDMLQVRMDSGQVLEINALEFNHFKYGYAATVHKLQGHTVKDCNVLIDGEGWDRHKFLVAATRHKISLTIHAAKESFADLDALKASVSRHGLNDILTDYPVAFAERRGFDLNKSAIRAVGIIQKSKAKIADAVGYLFNYQSVMEQDKAGYELTRLEIEARRRDAMIIAEFSDNRVELAMKLEQFNLNRESSSDALQESIYALQLRNGEIASIIESNPSHYKIALERNRVKGSVVEAALGFHKRHQFVDSLIRAYNNDETILPEQACVLMDGIKQYYGHVCHLVSESELRTRFLRDMDNRADSHRRETALISFGMNHRAIVNTAARYKALDYEVGSRIKDLADAPDANKQALYQASTMRDQLAAELIASPLSDELTAHFVIKPERLAQHDLKYQDRQFVKAFATLPESTMGQGNLVKQHAAHKIKSESKRFGIYIDEYLKDGWKQINLERWHYQRRQLIAGASPELKRSLLLVRRYKAAASSSYQQWQKAIARSQANSPHKNKGYKQAQGMSWKRSLLAHDIMSNMNAHVAALSMEKVDTIKLYRQALHVDYLNRYRAETRETLKNRMANHIHVNLKDFQAGLAVYGLYQDVKERAAHFAHLQRIKEAPDNEMKAAIRLSLAYQEKKVETGVIWAQVKALKQLGIDTKGLSLQAKQIMNQRNEAAHQLLQNSSNLDWLTKDKTGIALDLVKLRREANQYQANQMVLRYLASTPEQKGALAQSLLSNKACYHLLFDNKIDFETLKNEVQAYEKASLLKQQTSIRPEHKEQRVLWDVDLITQTLMNDPIETYKAILGTPKEQSSNHMRYSGGLIVATKGADAGKWYSFTEEVGGTPLSAIQRYLHLSFPEALAHGASIAGLSDFEAKMNHTTPAYRPAIKPVDTSHEIKIKQGVIAAQSIWQGCIDAKGSLAEQYFTDHRKVDSIDGMAIRYWPKGATWIDFDENGHQVEKPNKIPAAVIAAHNSIGEVVSVQRIYLDEKTAGKNTFLKDAKLTKGSNKGTPGLIQTGKKGGVLYVAEGPETAASIASINKEATVLVSFSVSNISNMADAIKAYAPKEVIITADNDGLNSSSRQTTQKACQTLRKKGIDARIVSPSMLPKRLKTDWNDVLVTYGKEYLAQSFNEKIAQSQFLYEKGLPIKGTVAEQYFNQSSASLDLTDVRFIEGIDFKGQSTPAILLPRKNAQGLLCGENVYALSSDGTVILGEGSKRSAQEGFYIAQVGHSNVLIIANTPLQAKMAQNEPHATVVLARPEEYEKLHQYLTQKSIKPSKVIVLSDDLAREKQMLIASNCHAFQTQGAEIYLKTNENNSIMKLDLVALEKARLKMNFEKLITQKPSVNNNEKPSLQAQFNELKKEYPLLANYEQHSKERKQVTGLAGELLDKKLLALAKEINLDKALMSRLKNEVPKLAQDVKNRIQQTLKRGGVKR